MQSMSFRLNVLFLLSCLCFLIPKSTLGQHNLLGNSGLIIIPTAYGDKEAQVRISSGFIPHPYYPVDSKQYDNRTYFISLVFLPFFEMSFGLVQPLKEVYGVGDRTTVFRFHLMSERKYRPALTLGMQDPFGVIAQDWAQRYCTLYLVASKSFSLPLVERFMVHFGQGSGLIKAGQHYLTGANKKNPYPHTSKIDDWPTPFAGLEVQPNRFSSLFIEYDTQYVNWGMRINIWRLSAMMAWLDRNNFCYSIGGHFSLPNRSLEGDK